MGWRNTISSAIAANRMLTIHCTTVDIHVPSPSVVTQLLIVVIIGTSRWSTTNTRTADAATWHDIIVRCLRRTAHRVVSGGSILVVHSQPHAVGAVVATW